MTAQAAGAALTPAAPRSLDTTGLHEDLLLDLAIKFLYFGELCGADLAVKLGLRYGLVEPLLGELRREHLAVVLSGAHTGAPSYLYRLTELGRARAAAALDRDRYVGQAPVALEDYRAFVAAVRSSAVAPVTRRSARAAFAHLVLTDAVVDQLGPAAAARHSLLLYGPPGTGKTVVSQAIRGLCGGNLPVPYALLVHGQIIRLFNPSFHEPAIAGGIACLEDDWDLDRRWILCRRPLVMATGGLDVGAFDLGSQREPGLCQAPLHIVANGGVLVIDDVTRQHSAAIDLLNRLMAPLENRADHLMLGTGQSFEMPFEAMLVVTTDVKPSAFMDDMFLRRIRHKIFLAAPGADEVVEIFANCCAERGLPFEADLAHWLLTNELASRHIALRRCHPRDLIEQALAVADYREEPHRLTRDLLAAACESYFLRDPDAYAA